MRKPGEYVPAAMAKLRGGSLSDCSEVLRHGGSTATVTRIGKAKRGGDEVTVAGVPENCRVLAYVADFPALKADEEVKLGETVRVVTSCSTGPVDSLLTVGLSEPLTRAMIKRVGAIPSKSAMVLVSDSNPYAENVGGASRAESWFVWLTCGDGDGRNGLARGTLVTFPDRPDIPCLYVQKCQRHGGLFCATCSVNERPSA